MAAVVIPASAIEEPSNTSQGTTITSIETEYEMILHQARAQALKNKKSSEYNILNEYRQTIVERSRMTTDELLGLGYSPEEIQALRQFGNGAMQFEEVAPLATAKLTSTITCSAHTASKYSFSYSWRWDKLPSGASQDGVMLGASGVTSSSTVLDTRIDSKSGSVNYVRMNGNAYKTETLTMTTSGGCVSSKFNFQKMDSAGLEYVWAKSGAVSVTYVPTVSTGKFAAAHVRGVYGHTSRTSATIKITPSIGKAGDISVAFDIVTGTAVATEYGDKQRVYYNDGTYKDE